MQLDTYTTIMLRAAQQMGCMLQVMPNREHLLKGYCPFHESSRIENSLTLLVDTNQGYFTCYNCKTRGNAKSFIARVWMVALSDVTLLTQQKPEAGMDRPAYPPDYLVPVTKKTRYSQRQNTAVLTLAAGYYRNNLDNNYEAIRFLINTGIEPRAARQLGLGFSNGQGLREYLTERGINKEEIQASPLFDPNSGREIMANRLTLAELDEAGGVSWLTSFTPPGNKPWDRQRPSTVPLPGRRPRLMNLRVLTSRQKAVALTDDPRLYIALCAQHIPSTLVTRRSPTTEQLSDYAESLTTVLERKKTRQITLMLQDNTAGARLHDRLRESRPKIRTRTALRPELDRLLNEGIIDQETLFVARRGKPAPQQSKEDETLEEQPSQENNGPRRFQPHPPKQETADDHKKSPTGCTRAPAEPSASQRPAGAENKDKEDTMANGPTMTLRGRLTRDPEMAYAISGTAYTRGRMACNRYHGEDQPEETYFVDITFWGYQAERASTWRRGDMIWVSGDWWPREYTYNGEKRTTEEIRVRDTFFVRGSADRTDRPSSAEDPGPAIMPDQEPTEDDEEWTD